LQNLSIQAQTLSIPTQTLSMHHSSTPPSPPQKKQKRGKLLVFLSLLHFDTLPHRGLWLTTPAAHATFVKMAVAPCRSAWCTARTYALFASSTMYWGWTLFNVSASTSFMHRSHVHVIFN